MSGGFIDDDDGGGKDLMSTYRDQNGLPENLPETFKLVGKTSEEMYADYSDNIFAIAMAAAVTDPDSKLGQKIVEKVVERKLDEIESGKNRKKEEMFKELNAISEEAMQQLEDGEITQEDLFFDEKTQMYIVRKNADYEVLDENGNVDGVAVDNVGNLYDPEEWDNQEVDDLDALDNR